MGRQLRTDFRGRSARRKTTWVGPADQDWVDVAGGTAVIVASFTPATGVPSMAEPTLVRTRGEVALAVDSIAVAIKVVGAYGLAVVSTASFTAGVASIPTPWSDPGWDGWFVWRSFSLKLAVASGVGFDMIQHTQEVDSKAMRKVTAAETIVLVAESEGEAFEISMPLRLLFKLS